MAQPRWVRGWLSPWQIGHGKEAAFAVATLCEPLEWEGVDGPEEVTLIFLLAIPPAEAGSTHIEVFTSRPADDDLRARVMAATTAEDVLTALDAAPGDRPTPSESAPTIVCVTACPAGIAHTYMAAEYGKRDAGWASTWWWKSRGERY